MNDIEFFDTETINNKTVLICNSQNYLWNSKGLSYQECFDFLLKHSKKYNYFFRIDYDINMIIKDLPKDKIIELFDKNETVYKKYSLKYFRHKIFSINNKKFYDIANFFQTSLLRNIEILNIDLTDKEKKFVEFMKKQRANFNLKDKNKIIEYSLLENKIGIKIVNKIYNLIPDDLKTYALYGSSSLANKFLKQQQIKRSFLFSNKIFEFAYFGGRMECLKIGKFENVYKYDINSAYPNIIKDLREPIKFEVKKYSGEKIIETNIYHIEFNHKTANEIGCFPVRLKNGYLVFPKSGSGYYYGCEIFQAIKREVNIKIKEVCEVTLGNILFENNIIEKLYQERLKLKQKQDLKNLIYKILLNSIYGKFAQTVGKAQFQNIYLAGYITSKVRSELLKATYKKDKDIIFFATDGILSKSKLNVKVSDKIGEFEEIKIKSAYVILAGIYYLIDFENKKYIGERGFRFDFDKAIHELKQGKTYNVKFKTFISNIYAFKNYKKYLNDRCKFVEIEKKLNIKQQYKRIFKTFVVEKENNSVLLTDKQIEKLNKKYSDMIDFVDLVSGGFDFDIL